MRVIVSTQAIFLLVPILFLGGCGGTKVLKKPEPLVASKALASASDEHLLVTLDWVVVRDGPGTWAKNADWDEYLLRLENKSGEPLQITNLTLVDSLGTPLAPETDRKKLVKSSRKTVRRYKDKNIKVKAGSGTTSLLVAGAAVTAVGGAAAAAAAYTTILAGGSSAGAAGAAAGGLLLLGPAIVVGGVVRGVNNSAVNKQITQRQATFPVEILPETVLPVAAFFPIAPSPQRLEVIYTDTDGEHRIVVYTSVAVAGLHIETR